MADPQGQSPQTNPQGAHEGVPGKHKNGDRRPFESAAFDGAGTTTQRDMTPGAMPGAVPVPDLWRESWRPIAAMQSEMVRWFDDLWRETVSGQSAGTFYGRMPGADLATGGFAGVPRADLTETGGDYRLHVELPGLKLTDVQVQIDGDTLIVRGVKSDARDTEAVNYHVSERRFGQIERRFVLPRDVDRGAVKADFHDGLLEIDLPKHADADEQRRRIEVRGG
jgi:HSP20 family protein